MRGVRHASALDFYIDQLSFSSVTSITFRSPFEKPTNSLFPRVFQAIEVTWWNLSVLVFLACFSSRFFFPSSLKFPSPTTGESLASKSQICHPTSVPIAIQWHLGLKARQLTDAPASWLGAGFSTSLKSKTLTFLSFPPVTMKFPLGETVTALMLPSCTLMLSLMLKVWLFQTLRYPSHPMEAKYCPPVVLDEVGMNRTLDTQSLWLCSLTVCLQFPLTFQSLISRSAPDERMYLPSEEIAQERISLLWPSSVNLWVVFPVLRSQSLRDLSHDEERRQLLSLVSARSLMKWECPVSCWTGSPKSEALLDSLLNFQMRMVLSLEAVMRT